jgi:hypothetical protein
VTATVHNARRTLKEEIAIGSIGIGVHFRAALSNIVFDAIDEVVAVAVVALRFGNPKEDTGDPLEI